MTATPFKRWLDRSAMLSYKARLCLHAFSAVGPALAWLRCERAAMDIRRAIGGQRSCCLLASSAVAQEGDKAIPKRPGPRDRDARRRLSALRQRLCGSDDAGRSDRCRSGPRNTMGSSENMPMLEAGQLDLGLVAGKSFYQALQGIGRPRAQTEDPDRDLSTPPACSRCARDSPYRTIAGSGRQARLPSAPRARAFRSWPLHAGRHRLEAG